MEELCSIKANALQQIQLAMASSSKLVHGTVVTVNYLSLSLLL